MASTPAAGGRIFISYRREDTASPDGWLFDRLAGHFGRDQIFKDIDPIEFGDDFAEMITTAVASCDVLEVLIGDRAFTIADKDGRRTLDVAAAPGTEAPAQRETRIQAAQQYRGC